LAFSLSSFRRSSFLLHELGLGMWSGTWGTVLERCRYLCPL
jgi:hypothetical protein